MEIFLNLLLECLRRRDSVRCWHRVDSEVLQKPEDDSRDHVLRHAGQLGRDRGGPMCHVGTVMLSAEPTKKSGKVCDSEHF